MSYPPPRPPCPQSPPTPSYPIQHPSPPFDASTPPPPPPKPSSHEPSRMSTPQNGPPLPPPPPESASYSTEQQQSRYPLPPTELPSNGPPPPGIDDGWLPDIVCDKSTTDIQHLLSSHPLLAALLLSPSTTHPSLPPTISQPLSLSDRNTALAHQVLHLSQQLSAQRTSTSTHLLHLHALERQWRQKQAQLDDALAPFSPKALHQRLVQSIGEQELLLRGMEESFLEGEGKAPEREVEYFLRKWREVRKVAERRREQRARWEEGRVGGWR